MVLVEEVCELGCRVLMRIAIGMLWGTYVVSFNIWYGQLFGNKLSDGALATSCRAGDDPHMAVVMGGQSTMDLLDGGRWCVIHG